MKLIINNHIHLTEIRRSDCVEHLNEKEIYDRTLRLPYPYTEADLERITTLQRQEPGLGGLR